ncbi:hypothetical protein RI054_02g13370 [Pseudoscourfieldia marina]
MSHDDDDDENIPPPPPHARAGLSLRTHVRKMQNFDSALDALGAYDSLSRGSYATSRSKKSAPRMLESSARLRLADAVQSDEDAKTAMMNVLLLVVLCDAMGIFLMTPVTPRIYNEAPA